MSQSLTLGEEIKEISDKQLKKQLWQDGWETFGAGGMEDPEYTVLKMMPAFARGGYKEKPFEFKLK
jgi:general stress protein 26